MQIGTMNDILDQDLRTNEHYKHKQKEDKLLKDK